MNDIGCECVVRGIVEALGGLSGMLDAYRSYRREMEYRSDTYLTRDQVVSILRRAEESRTKFLQDYGGKNFASVRVISQKILDKAHRRIKDAEERYADAITSISNTPQQQDQEKKIAHFEICRILQLIRDHNSGELPSNDYENLWVSYRCDADDTRIGRSCFGAARLNMRDVWVTMPMRPPSR